MWPLTPAVIFKQLETALSGTAEKKLVVKVKLAVHFAVLGTVWHC